MKSKSSIILNWKSRLRFLLKGIRIVNLPLGKQKVEEFIGIPHITRKEKNG